MKVYLNRSPVAGPWGGANRTVIQLSNSLKANNCEVVYDLEDDIDVIFCFDPRHNNKGAWFRDFVDYRNKTNCKIIQRVGDVGSHGKPELTSLVSQTIHFSDFIIFPSDWAREVIKFKGKNYAVIPNSPVEDFYINRRENLTLSKKVKIVTHHWSTNDMKGFDIYSAFGKFCENWKDKVEFTYIGRFSDKFSNVGINLIGPSDLDFLSSELPKHDIYLTASRQEAGANHVLEALAAGLPIVFGRAGGSIQEYCTAYGIEYDDQNSLIEAIESMIFNYSFYKRRALSFNRKLKDTIDHYVNIILSNE